MASSELSSPCLIIGAGLSGLMAARRLADQGLNPTILERASFVGGRTASMKLAEGPTESDNAVFDCGAQFFTVRQPAFVEVVAGWLELGIVCEWSRGFAAGDGSYFADGHPRYRGHPTMTAIAEHLADGLDVRLEHNVVSIAANEGQWLAITDKGQKLTAQSLIVTTPLPISLRLLMAGEFPIPTEIQNMLRKIDFDPCIALMALSEGPGSFPEPGGMWPSGGHIDWMADNHRKGISPQFGAFTIHADAEFSREHWKSSDETICRLLFAAAEPWIGSTIKEYCVYRWRYSKPTWTLPDACLGITEPVPLVFAGDAFAGPRIEGAALSGLAAAEWLLQAGC